MKRVLIIFIIGLCLGNGQQAYSRSGALSLDILVNNADLIVLGRVDEVTSFKSEVMHKEGGYAILSKARVIPESFVKGHEEGPIIIEFAGGRVGKSISLPEDSPRFAGGERAILFLKRIGDNGAYAVVGMAQGKYMIKNDTVPRKNVTVDKFLEEIKSLRNRTDEK